MGGFVNENEGVDEAAKRILYQLTGLDKIYMEQLYCFGDAERDDGGRVISVAYFALIRADDYDGVLMSQYHTQWFDLDELPKLIFDHKKMLQMAKEKLQQTVIEAADELDLFVDHALPDDVVLDSDEWRIKAVLYPDGAPQEQYRAADGAPDTPWMEK